jgi:hypothetical protein
LIKFFVWLTLTAALLLGLLLSVYEFAWIRQKPSFLYPTLFLLFFGTALIYRYLYKLNNPGFFVQLYLLLMVIKLIVYLAYNVFMVLKDKQGAGTNVVFFLITYFVFTVLEIVFLHHHVNKERHA